MIRNQRERNYHGKAGRVFPGREFGSYTVLKLFGSDRPQDRVLVECVCGDTFVIRINALLHGAQRCYDCGMLARRAKRCGAK